MLTMPLPVPRWLVYVLTSPSSPIHIQSARKLRKASKSAITLLYSNSVFPGTYSPLRSAIEIVSSLLTHVEERDENAKTYRAGLLAYSLCFYP